MPFVRASSRVWTEWTYFYTEWGYINSICGFGKEQPSETADSFTAIAVSLGYLESNVYSFEITPHMQQNSAANNHFNLKVRHEVESQRLSLSTPRRSSFKL